MPPTSDFGFFQLELRVNDTDDYPIFSDLNYFLLDLDLLYEFSRVMVDPKYAEYRFSRFFMYRNRRRVEPDDQLRIQRLTQESPLQLVAVVAAIPAAATAIWVVVQTWEKIANFQLNRDILKLNREKLRRELARPADAMAEVNYEQFVERVRMREAEYMYDRIEHHVAQNPIRIREIDVTYVRELPPKNK